MKEIKAFVRINMLDKVIHGLETAGFSDMTVIDVKAIREGLGTEDVNYSVELVERYMNVAKLELVVEDSAVDSVMEIIRDTARTGRKGDGLIYVSPVLEAVHIRTGANENN